MALMPVTDALAAILDGAEPLGQEIVALDAAFHRTLARDVTARRTQLKRKQPDWQPRYDRWVCLPGTR